MITIKGYEIAGRMPIFTTENRALVRSGAKTQTRRVMKQQYIKLDGGGNPYIDMGYPDDWDGAGLRRDIRCPYGEVSDIRVLPEPLEQLGPFVWYKDTQTEYRDSVGERAVWQWKRDTLSSMFMPTWAGRVLIRYTDIRVERLQDISVADAKAEGIPNDINIAQYNDYGTGSIHVDAFAELWDSINAKKHPWPSNPWVWVIEWELL